MNKVTGISGYFVRAFFICKIIVDIPDFGLMMAGDG